MKRTILIASQAIAIATAILAGYYVFIYGFAAIVNGSKFHFWTIPVFILGTIAAFILSVVNNFLFEKWRRERNQDRQHRHFKQPGRFEQRLKEMDKQRNSN